MIGLLLAVLVIPLGLAVSGTSGHQTSSATVVRAAASVGTTIGCQDRTYDSWFRGTAPTGAATAT